MSDLPNPPLDARRARVRRQAGVAFALLLAFLFVELGLRASRVAAALGGPGGGMDTAWLFADYPLEQRDSFYELKRDYHGLLWGRLFKTDENGFRTPSVEVARSAGSLRVLLLGTCITLGEIDDTSDGWSLLAATLEAELRAALPGVQVQVLNAAVPGSFELQHLVRWRQELRRFAPDLVLLEAGTTQTIDTVALLDEYLARPAGSARPATGKRVWGPREVLNDAFDRSVALSHFFTLRRSKELLFRKYFYRRPDAPEPAPSSARVEQYVQQVVDPATGYYAADLERLLTALVEDGTQVVTYNFPHALPWDDYAALPEWTQARFRKIEFMLRLPDEMGASESWDLFRYTYDATRRLTREVSQSAGAHYVDLGAERRLRVGADYHPYYYYLPRTTGTVEKGKVLARHLLAHYEFDDDGARVAVTESP